MLQCVAVRVLQCVAVRCSVVQYVAVRALQCVAACCSVLQRVFCTTASSNRNSEKFVCRRVVQYSAVCYSVLQSVAVCCSLLQSVAVRCSVLHCVCCSATSANRNSEKVTSVCTATHSNNRLQ